MNNAPQKIPHLWMPLLGSALIVAGIALQVAEGLQAGYLKTNPAPLVQIAPQPNVPRMPYLGREVLGVRWAGLVKPKPKRRLLARAKTKAPPLRIPRPSKPRLLNARVDEFLAESSRPADAWDVGEPLGELTDEGLLEEAVAWHRALTWGPPPERGVMPYLETLGTFERNDYSHLNQSLARVRGALDKLKIDPLPEAPAPRPEPTLVRPPAEKVVTRSSPKAKRGVAATRATRAKEPQLIHPKEQPEPTLVRPFAAPTLVVTAPTSEPEEADAAPMAQPVDNTTAHPTLEARADAKNGPTLVAKRTVGVLDARAELAGPVLVVPPESTRPSRPEPTLEKPVPSPVSPLVLDARAELEDESPVLDARAELVSPPQAGPPVDVEKLPALDARSALEKLASVAPVQPEAPLTRTAGPAVTTGHSGRLKWIAKLDTPAVQGPQPAPLTPPSRALKTTPSTYVGRTHGDTKGIGRVFGKLSWDAGVRKWLETTKGHIELSVEKIGSRNAQDSLFVPYQYPAEDFLFELHGSRSKHRLFARVFSPKKAEPVAEIPYEEVIGPDNFRKKIRFHLDAQTFAKWRRGSVAQSGRTLVLTLFEGGTGDVREARSIKGASVQVIGFPEFGVRIADSQGNIRLKDLPTHSEFLVRASAPGYFPTYKVLPIFRADSYLPLYLVPRKRVSAINDFRYLVSDLPDKSTKALKLNNPFDQDPRKGFVMGRTFDPIRRQPLAGEVFGLTFRKSPPLYFGALPAPDLKSTTNSGMFSFFNVTPSFRAIRRETEGGLHRPVSLVKVRPGTGQYVEFGRGGVQDLQARVWDPYRGLAPAARVRMVGDNRPRLETNEAGKFVVEDVDLGPGVITLEVQSDGYPLTWHTISWNPRSPVLQRNLFVMEEDVVRESAERFAGLKRESSGGAIVGGAESSFFKQSDCVTVALFDDQGQKVPQAMGPFPLSEKPQEDGSLCLTRAKPGFSYFNLPSGEYVLRWSNEASKVLRAHVIHVGVSRVTVVVN